MTAITAIVIFLLMVSIHEFGHFIVAKKSGMTVTEFAVGMGPLIYGKEKGGTLYSVRALPLGGYCKIEDDLTEDKKAFKVALWKRFLMVLAGPALNIVLGFFVIMLLVGLSGELSTTVVSEFSEGAQMRESGIEVGDKIVGINDTRIHFYEDMSLCINEFKDGTPVEVTVKRNGEKHKYSVSPTKSIVKYQYLDDGINVISTTGGKTTEKMVYYDENVAKNEALVGTEEVASERYILGFVPKRESINPINLIHESLCYTGFVVKLVYKTFFMLVTGQLSMDNVSGPVGVIQEVDKAVNGGFRYVLNLMAILTINLGVFNLLPIPALDGGRVVFMVIEFIFRKPVPPEKEGMVHMIGMILLLLFSVFISYKDIMKLITK